MKLISACLVGINCRWDGKNRLNRKCLKLFKKGGFIPVCPEQLGGLSTPREPSEQKGNKVITKSARDVTENFEMGAKEVLKLAKRLNIKEAILKSKSSSCGSGSIYDGSFSGELIPGDGVTTALLKRNGLRVITEKDI